MRIGMMADVYKPHVSGITNYISLNKRVLEQQGHEVYIFTFSDDDYVDDEPNVIRSPGLPLLDTGFYISLRYGPVARKLLRTMDIIHVHHPFLSGSLALRYCRPRGIPIIFTNHTRYDLYARAYLPILPDIIGETALEAYMPTFCRSCDLVIAPSNGMKKILENLGVDAPIEVIPNGVDFSMLQRNLKPLDRGELGFSEDDTVLIYTGRLGPEKNLPFLLRSFAGVVEAFGNTRLLIVGDGPERDNLEDRANLMGIESNVFFTGMVPYQEVYKYLSSSDIFVTASVTEVHPLSVIEAMAAGKPVLGIDSPGIGDIINNGSNGYLVKSEDLAAFTAKLTRMIGDHDLRKKMGENAREYAVVFDINRTAEIMLEKYSATIDQKQSQGLNFRARVTRLLDKFKR